MKPFPLKFKLTLLCALIIIAVAAILTATSMANANRFFVKNMKTESTVTTEGDVTASAFLSKSVKIPPENEFTPSVEFSPSSETLASDGLNDFVTISIAKKQFNSHSLIFMGILIVLSIAVTYWITAKSLKPVTLLAKNMHEIDENNLSLRLEETQTSSEMMQLSASFNRMLEKLDQAFSMQKNFAQAAAHELKTPLACMRATIEVLNLDDTPSTEDYQKTLRVIGRNTDRLIDLVDDLLHRNTQDGEQTSWIPLENCVCESLELFKIQIEQKNLQISTACHGSVHANQTLIDRLIANLIENAVKYTQPKGEIRITCHQSHHNIIFEISNTAPPIPDEDLAHIFEPFYRVDKSRSRDIAGSGLGLALACDIVTKYHGTICTVHDGTFLSFTVTLPQK